MKDLIYTNGVNIGAIMTGENLIMFATGILTVIRILIGIRDLFKK